MKAMTIAVIGAGPAGLSAALWLKNLGLTPIVIEREAKTGGMQNFNFLHNDWVLGQLAPTGLNMADSFERHIKERAIDIRLRCAIDAIKRVDDGGFSLDLKKIIHSDESLVDNQKKNRKDTQKETMHCDGIILANGTRYLGKEVMFQVQGIHQLEHNDIIEGPYAFADIERHNNKRVLIIGAGDNAFENAAMLLQRGCHVTVVARSTPKARSQFVDEVIAHPKAVIMEKASVISVEKNHSNEIKVAIETSGIAQKNQNSSSVNNIILIDQIHILAGYCSNVDTVNTLMSSGVGEVLRCDENQFLLVDRLGRTNILHVYAAGDICNSDFPCVVSAVASGALAAKTVSKDLLG
jgi:thioredoxin reductase (NADPH)